MNEALVDPPARHRPVEPWPAVNEAVTRWLMTTGGGEELPTLEDFLHRPEWHQRAACRGVGAAAYVIGRGGQYDAARELCAVCPVHDECLAVALADPELMGLWGGTTERERRAMRRARVA
jgi:WhiB family redox-sensing transcriptional regulator